MHIDTIVKVNDVTTIVVRSQNFAINVTLCLRLRAICCHNIFEFRRQIPCTRKYINGAHNQLVQVTILHEINAMQNRILECCPNFLQILIGLQVQVGGQLFNAYKCQFVEFTQEQADGIADIVFLLW